jgi:outer membrane protein TolC
MLKKLISCALVFFLAQEAFSKDYKIEELLEIAEQNSKIKSAEFLALSQNKIANQQKYWSNPTVSFSRNSNQENYSISQAIPFAGKLQSKYDIEEAEYRVLETRKQNLALFIKAELFTLLYQHAALKKKIELAKKRLARLSLVDQYLTSIVLNSPTKRAQGQITKDRIRLIERDLMNFQNQLYQTWNRANIYLNLENEPGEIVISWLDDQNYPGKNFIISAALEHNFGLKEQALLLKKYQSELSFAKIEQMPDFNVSATQQNNSASSGSKDSSGVGLSLSIPLLNRNQEKILAAESKIKSQKYEFEFQKNQLLNMVSNGINEFETSLKIARNFPISNISKILSRLSQANSDFKKGVLEFITYIELDSQEYQTVDSIIDTQVQLATAYADLMTKTGNFILPKNE